MRSNTNRTKISQNTKKKVSVPPILVQRCYSTTVGLGYFEGLNPGQATLWDFSQWNRDYGLIELQRASAIETFI